MSGNQSTARPASATIALVVALVLFAGALALRTAGVWWGVLYGARQTEALTYLVAMLAALVWALWRWKAVRDGRHGLAEAAAVLAGVVALVPALTLALPSATHGATVAACENSRLYGTDFRAMTLAKAKGAIARSGPGYSHEPVGRFPADCLLGFVGYCVGEPVDETFSGRPNSRWLLLAKPDGGMRHRLAKIFSGEPDEPRRFVSDAIVLAQDPDSMLKPLQDEDCEGGQPGPGKAELADPARAKGDAIAYDMTVNAPRAHDLGIAVWVGTESAGAEFRAVDFDPRLSTATLTATWRSAGTAITLAEDSREVVVAGTACLAGDVPADPDDAAYAVVRVSGKGRLTRLKKDAETFVGSENWPEVSDRLVAIACAVVE